MSQELTLFPGGNALPDYFGSFAEDHANIEDRATVPTLSFSGKVWATVVGGIKTKLERRNPEGDLEPVSVVRVILLDFAQRQGRSYYETNYDPDKPGRPLCWSSDGIKPSSSIQEPQATACAACPKAIKGSKITAQGKATVACSKHRLLAVLPSSKFDHTPMRLKLAITSDWDATGEEQQSQNWYAFQQYRDYLRAHNCKHTAFVVTKMKFDPNTEYPKVLFSPDRMLTAAEWAQIKPIVTSESVAGLISDEWTPNGMDGTKTAQEPSAPVKAIKKEAAISEEAAEADAFGAVEAAPKATTKPATKPAPAPKPLKVVPKVPTADMDELLDDWTPAVK